MNDAQTDRSPVAPVETQDEPAYEPPKILESARFEVVAQGCDYDAGNINCEPFTSG